MLAALPFSTTDVRRDLTHVYVREARYHRLLPKYTKTTSFKDFHRRELFRWMFDVLTEMHFSYNTVETSFRIFDMYVGTRNRNIATPAAQTIGCACMLLASKVTSMDKEFDIVGDLEVFSNYSSSVKMIHEYEEKITIALDFDVMTYTLIDVVHDVARLQCFPSRAVRNSIVSEAVLVCLMVHLHTDLLHMPMHNLVPAILQLGSVRARIRFVYTFPDWITQKTTGGEVATVYCALLDTLTTKDVTLFAEFSHTPIEDLYSLIPLHVPSFFDTTPHINKKKRKL